MTYTATHQQGAIEIVWLHFYVQLVSLKYPLRWGWNLDSALIGDMASRLSKGGS